MRAVVQCHKPFGVRTPLLTMTMMMMMISLSLSLHIYETVICAIILSFAFRIRSILLLQCCPAEHAGFIRHI